MNTAFKSLAISALALAAVAAQAQNPAPAHAAPRSAVALCDHCGTVQQVRYIKRKGEGGAVGMVGGAVVGGLLGHQIGGGTGKTLATVGGAAAGAYAGNEVQKQVNSRSVWVTTVKMKDGSVHDFEQAAKPVWISGNRVRVHEDRTLTKL
jgi:outer membrane lipoprotein SlyB